VPFCDMGAANASPENARTPRESAERLKRLLM
jgi:hypothetical protein